MKPSSPGHPKHRPSRQALRRWLMLCLCLAATLSLGLGLSACSSSRSRESSESSQTQSDSSNPAAVETAQPLNNALPAQEIPAEEALGPLAPSDEGEASNSESAAPEESSSLEAPDESPDGATEPISASTATTSVRFLNVGQGDAALIGSDGHYALIDGGPSSASDVIYTVLKNSGIDHLDYIIATHPDEDHIGGIAAALNAATSDHLYCSTTTSDTRTFENMVRYADERGCPIEVPNTGQILPLGSATLTFVGPVETLDSENNNSLIVRLDHGESSVLFMGDAEHAEEQSLMNAGVPLQADVLKVGHHGSKSSSSSAFIDAVGPAFAVISVGENSYGHPNPAVLDGLQSRQINVLRTDERGDITLETDGQSLTLTDSQGTIYD